MANPTYRSALYRAMQDASDIAGTTVKATFSRQIGALIDSTSIASIERGISGGIKGVVDSVDWAGLEGNLREEYERRLARAMKQGADQFKKRFPKIEYDPGAPGIQRAIKKRARELAQQLTKESKKGFRQAARGLFREGAGRRRTARELKDMIGLTRKEAQAVINVRSAMLEKDLGAGAIDKRSTQLVRKYRRQRGARIARTAGADISNLGQDLALKQAIKSGDVEEKEVEKVWIVDMDACPICAPMQGQRRSPGRAFTTGKGGEVDGPPVHPNCRCATTVKLKEGS